ncbi:MAG: DUF3857 domain-containing protein, partial [Calditrichaceae bacterium]
MKILIINTLLLFVISFSVAEVVQDDTTKSVDPGVLNLLKNTIINESYTKAGAVILLKEATSIVDSNNLVTCQMHIVGKILNDKAKSDYAQIPIFFNSYYSDIVLEYARTIKTDGSVITISKDAVQIKNRPNYGEGITYSDQKVLNFSLPGLEVGSAFEFKIKYIDSRKIIDNQWFDANNFYFIHYDLSPPYMVRIDPVYESKFQLKVPKGQNFISSTRNCEPITTISPDDKFDIYEW